MIVWLLLVTLTAGVNLFGFIAVRGRWGALTPFLAVAAIVGTALGNAIGGRLSIDLVRIGEFEFVAASIGAQLGMVATALLAALVPAAAPPTDEP